MLTYKLPTIPPFGRDPAFFNEIWVAGQTTHYQPLTKHVPPPPNSRQYRHPSRGQDREHGLGHRHDWPHDPTSRPGRLWPVHDGHDLPAVLRDSGRFRTDPDPDPAHLPSGCG